MGSPLQQHFALAKEQFYSSKMIQAAVYGLAAYLVLSSAWRYAKYKIMDRYTAMYDVEYVGRPRNGPKLKGTAIVAGGSFAGLLAARMLSDQYEKVLVLESEDVKAGKDRKFVMQYNQVSWSPSISCQLIFPSVTHLPGLCL
jgi:hypothetical protein